VAAAVTQEWGEGLIRSWNTAGWFDCRSAWATRSRACRRRPGEVVATDSTSINLYKVLSAALNIAAQDAPQRKRS
jgi:kynureninase